MLNFKGMRFPIDVILVCIRWYAAYPLSYRHLPVGRAKSPTPGRVKIPHLLTV